MMDSNEMLEPFISAIEPASVAATDHVRADDASFFLPEESATFWQLATRPTDLLDPHDRLQCRTQTTALMIEQVFAVVVERLPVAGRAEGWVAYAEYAKTFAVDRSYAPGYQAGFRI